MGRIILLEGMDLAGKTTAVRELQQRFQIMGLQVLVRSNALCAGNHLAALAELGCEEPDRTGLEGFCGFLAAHLWDVRHFTPPGPNQLHLQDSCWMRTLAHEEALGSPELAALLRQNAVHFPRFDQAVFLSADLATRQARYGTRRHNNGLDALVFTEPRHFLKIEEQLRKVTFEFAPTVEIDTSKMQPEEVLEACFQVFSPQLATSVCANSEPRSV